MLETAVVADGSVSDDEVEGIGEVVAAFGEDEYRKLVDEVSRFRSQDDLMKFLETIQRPEARDLIYGFLLEEATIGEALRGREAELVDRLAKVWNIDVKIDDSETP